MSVFATAVCAPSPTRNQPALATESSLVRTWAEVTLCCQSVLVGIIAKLLIQQCRKVAECFKAPVLKDGRRYSVECLSVSFDLIFQAISEDDGASDNVVYHPVLGSLGPTLGPKIVCLNECLMPPRRCIMRIREQTPMLDVTAHA